MKHKKTILAASLLAVALTTTGVTLAFLTTSTKEVVNTFEPTSVPIHVNENFEDNVKSNVRIQNDGNIPAYIRAAIVVNWAKWNTETMQYDVLGTPPVAGTVEERADYTIEYDLANGWIEHEGYYYWTKSVPAEDDTETLEEEDMTGVLITSCTVNNPAPVEGYTLQVDILAQSVQSEPDDAVLALWGVDPTTLKED